MELKQNRDFLEKTMTLKDWATLLKKGIDNSFNALLLSYFG